jgi:hypothetical protein
MSGLSKREAVLRAQMRAEKEQIRKRIECNPQWKKDFDFLIDKTGWEQGRLIYGLWMDCNLMSADSQTLVRNEKKEVWPISEDTLRRDINNIRRIANRVNAINQTKVFSPTVSKNMGRNFVVLSEELRLYAGELERRVSILAPYWKRKRSHIPGVVALTRENSLYAHIESSAGRFHQTRLLRLVNVAREVKGYPLISQRAFTIWLNRLKNRRKKEKS